MFFYFVSNKLSNVCFGLLLVTSFESINKFTALGDKNVHLRTSDKRISEVLTSSVNEVNDQHRWIVSKEIKL